METTFDSVQPFQDDESAPSKGSLPSRVCLLTFGDERLAVELSQVREIFKPDSITSVPGMPQALIGVANLRGTIVPIVELHPWLGVRTKAAPNYAVILRHEARQVGVLIEEVPEIHQTESGDMLEQPSAEAMRQRPFLSGVLNMAGRAIGMMDVSRLLAMVEDGSDLQAA